MGNQSEADDSSPSLKTIFVVEDDADLSFVLLRFLEEEVPCHVVLATDGFEALKLVRSITPHLFLLDYHLPSMTGLELVDQLRAIPTLEQTPIILMSARMPRDGVKQRQLPAIHKPFDLNHLLQVVREQLPASDEFLFSSRCRFRFAGPQQVRHRYLLPFIEIGACQQAQVQVQFPQ